jgi:hypothetical protein
MDDKNNYERMDTLNKYGKHKAKVKSGQGNKKANERGK